VNELETGPYNNTIFVLLQIIEKMLEMMACW